MRNGQGTFGKLRALALLGGAVMLLGNSGGGTSVSVTITNIRSSEGVVRICMTEDEDRFPRCRNDANAHRRVVDANGTVRLTFTGVAPGRYAIAVLHDENNNNKADRALGMMPKEGFGFSRDARVRMGPPSFSSAAINIGSEAVTHSIRMRYML